MDSKITILGGKVTFKPLKANVTKILLNQIYKVYSKI